MRRERWRERERGGERGKKPLSNRVHLYIWLVIGETITVCVCICYVNGVYAAWPNEKQLSQDLRMCQTTMADAWTTQLFILDMHVLFRHLSVWFCFFHLTFYNHPSSSYRQNKTNMNIFRGFPAFIMKGHWIHWNYLWPQYSSLIEELKRQACYFNRQ